MSDQKMRHRVLSFVLGLALLMTLIPAVAAQDGSDVVSTVNSEPVLRATFQARVRFVRWQYLKELEKLYELTGGNLLLSPAYAENLMTDLNTPDTLGDSVLGQMEEDRLLWQASADLGVALAAGDADAREKAFFSLWTDVPADEIDSDPDAQSFITLWYAEAVAVSGLSEDDIHAMFATEALRSRLYKRLSSSVPQEELAVNSRHILCSFHPDNLNDMRAPTDDQRAAARACVDEALNRLAVGDSFETVARDLSDDLASAQQGGNVGWVVLSYLAQGYADAVRDAELNTIIGPVETEFGLHVIEVLDRRMQTLTNEEYENSKQGYFLLWLDTLRTDATITRSDDWAAGLPVDPALDTLDPAILAALDQVVSSTE